MYRWYVAAISKRGPLGRTLVVGFSTVAVALVLLFAAPAGAVHLFPLTPTADPLGHDCAKNLVANPGNAQASVRVAGFNFLDTRTNTSATNISAGQSVAWTWLLDHCHSVTFVGGRGTQGAEGFMPAGQPQLVRLNGSGKDTFVLAFPEPGTYQYSCVHHASVGMTGTVVVAAAPASAAPSGASGGGENPPQSSPAPSDPSVGSATLPRTGGGKPLFLSGALLTLGCALALRSRASRR